VSTSAIFKVYIHANLHRHLWSMVKMESFMDCELVSQLKEVYGNNYLVL
jgi:hypothetical protein